MKINTDFTLSDYNSDDLNTDFTLSDYNSDDLKKWWDNRDILIGWLLAGSCSSSNPDHQAVFELLSTPT